MEKAGYTMNTTSANKEEGKTETASSMLPSAKVSATIASVSGTMPGYGRELEWSQIIRSREGNGRRSCPRKDTALPTGSVCYDHD